MIRTSLTFIIFAVLFGCASNMTKILDQVKPGMDKDRVLEVAGNPTRTFREDSQDHWVYTYFSRDQQWLREVIFDDGKVAKVTHAVAKEAWVKDLEKAQTMEEYESKAREHQRKAKSKGDGEG